MFGRFDGSEPVNPPKVGVHALLRSVGMADDPPVGPDLPKLRRIGAVIVPRLRFMTVGLVGLVLLTACGDTFVPPAAVVNGVRIAQDALEGRLNLLLTDPTLAAQVSGAGGKVRRADLTRQVLGFMIRQQIIEAYARAHAITVSEAEVEQSLQEAIQQVGGQEAFEQELRRRGLTVENVRRNIAEALLSNRVRDDVALARLGASGTPTPEQADQAFGDWIREQLGRADIEVNPRFGGFDVEQATVCRIVSTAGDLSCGEA